MYAIVTSREDLWKHFDDVVRLVRHMVKRTGSHGQSTETVLDLMLRYVESPLGYNLLRFNDDTGALEGVLFAVAVQTPREVWVEVVALSAPRVAALNKEEAFDMLATWAKGLGATKILTVLTRSPERFFQFFHEKLGFEKVGTLLERRL